MQRKNYEFLGGIMEIFSVRQLAKKLKNKQGKPISSSYIGKCEAGAKRANGQPFIYSADLLKQMEGVMYAISMACLEAALKFGACAAEYETYLAEGADAAFEKHKKKKEK